MMWRQWWRSLRHAGLTGALAVACFGVGTGAQTPAPPPPPPAPAAQLASPDRDARLRAVRDLKAQGTPADATSLTGLIADEDDEVQFEAMATELNIFLAEKVTPSRRVGLIVEVRGQISAQEIF